MKAWIWLPWIILTFLIGCAPGYYQKGSDYEEPSPAFSGMTYTNPETTEEYQRRIWIESMHP